MQILLKIALVAGVLSALVGTVHAQSTTLMAASPWVVTDQTEVRLVAATGATGDTDTVRLGLQFKLIPGWKVYWRNPGAAGFPPAIDWGGSSNYADSVTLWPAPERFSVLGLDTLGYKDEVVFPIDVRLEQAGEPLVVAAQVDYLTCDDICVPYTADLALTLPSGPTFPSPFGRLIDRYAAQVPGDGTDAGLRIEDAAAVGAAGDQVLRVSAAADPAFDDPDLYVEAPAQFEFLAPRIRYVDDRHAATFEVDVLTIGSDKPDLAGNDITLTLVDGGRAIESAVVRVPATGSASDLRVMLGILVLALFGGLILNLMPCVLPVLSLKLLSVVKHGGGERHQVRRGFLATAAGIVVSFLVIAGALIAVKSAGMAIGWGIQFQQPVFLVAMTLILVLFAANLWGLFEIRLPGALGDRLGRPGAESTLVGHFATGAFATLLATPCSAPFLGSAIGFALSRGPTEIVVVFATLGLGLAVPYLLVAAFPGLATSLPRPGHWMITLRRILGVALAVTAAWLLSILAAQTGLTASLAVFAAMVVILAAFWLGRRLFRTAGSVAWIVVIVVGALALAAPAALREQPASAGSMAESDDVWSPFDVDEIASLVRDGHVVFVDVTADWCLTCKVNKRLVLDSDPVATAISDPNVVAMQADWTRPDDVIAAYLAGFGRYGIPFDAVYGPGAPRGLPLPELLTSDAVMAAIRRAAAGG